MNKWKEVWKKRTLKSSNIDLDSLIKVDGFDQGAGQIKVADWRMYVQKICAKLGIEKGSTFFEVGCGAGAFLYAMRERERERESTPLVGGIDYAEVLINAAKKAMPDGEFKVMEAKDLDILPQFDYVIANSVFHYFTLEYAEEVLHRMIKKAKSAIAVMDIPDAATKEESETLRRNIMTPFEYEKKYKGLEHTYYQRNWFKEQAATYGLSCVTFDGCVPNYAQNRFRFGCIISKSNTI